MRPSRPVTACQQLLCLHRCEDWCLHQDELKLHQRSRHMNMKGSPVWAVVLIGMLGTFCWFYRRTLP